MTGLTQRQSDCLAVMRAHKERTGVMPTRRQIAEGLGVASTNNVARLVNALEARGHIHRTPYRKLGIQLVEAR